MTRTMTLNHDSPRTRNPIGAITPDASIPRFMEYGFGAASVLQRSKRDVAYIERWIRTDCHPASFQEGASHDEIRSYLTGHNIDIDDMPEAIDIHSADDWEYMSGMDDGDPHVLSVKELERLVS